MSLDNVLATLRAERAAVGEKLDELQSQASKLDQIIALAEQLSWEEFIEAPAAHGVTVSPIEEETDGGGARVP